MEDLKSLSDLFNDKIFRIPNYQRGFSWENEQLEEFFEDVLNLPEGNEHYTGMISLEELTNDEIKEKEILWNDALWLINKGYHAYHVVDGQQRLTTIIILIQAIIETYRKKTGKKDEEIIMNDTKLSEIVEQYIVKIKPGSDDSISTYLLGYEVDKPSDDYLKNKILNPQYEGKINESFYTLNLDNAKNFFLQKLDDLYEKNKNFVEIENIFRKVTQKLKFVLYYINKDFNVNVAFETMNNRGKKLTTLELLKNRLIYLTSLFNISPDEKYALIDNINETWKTIYSYLGKDKHCKLSDDDFLIAHSYLYFGYIADLRKSYSQFLLKKYFKQTRIFSLLSDSETNSDYDIVLDDSESPDLIEEGNETEIDFSEKLTRKDVNQYIQSLQSLVPYWYMIHAANYETDVPEINEWLTKLNRLEYNYYKPLVLVALSKKEIPDEKKLQLLKSIERFIFVIFRLCGYQSTYNRNQIYNYTHDLYLNKVDIDTIIQFIDHLVVLSDNHVMPFSALQTTVTRLFKRDGFYSWSTNKYFLYEYESYLMERYRGTPKISDDYFVAKKDTKKVSIEHIFPQTENASQWIQVFKKYSLAERDRFRGTLGNLLPLSLDINKELQADEFIKKCKRYENGSYSEQEVSKKEEWNDLSILERGMNLVHFLEERWEFLFENDKARKSFLGLDFMISKEDEETDVNIPVYNEKEKITGKQITTMNLDEDFYLTIGDETYAKGIYMNGGILVKKGSKIRLNIEAATPYMQKKVDLAREDSRIKDDYFIEDVFYDSPSMAANVVLGNNKNGWTSWKNSAGVTLDELVRNKRNGV